MAKKKGGLPPVPAKTAAPVGGGHAYNYVWTPTTYGTPCKWDTSQAMRIAALGHYGQNDKGGAPYINHCAGVAAIFRSKYADGLTKHEVEVGVQAAWLHDVLEDTPFTPSMLHMLKVPTEVIEIVLAVTKGTESREQYMERILQNGEVARRVKLADCDHNTLPERLEVLKDYQRKNSIEKCQWTIDYLNGEEVEPWRSWKPSGTGSGGSAPASSRVGH